MDSIVVDTSGKVGIGTTTPWSKLSIRVDGLNEGSDVQSASGWIRYFPGTMGNFSYNSLSRAGDNGIIFSSGSLNTGNLVIGPHADSAAGIKILSNGNVGIGTASPTSKLSVYVDELNKGSNVESGSGWIRFIPGTMGAGAYNSLSRAGDNGIIFSGGSLNTGNLVIAPHADSAAGIRILSNGNVGIETNTPAMKLDVNGDARFRTNGDVWSSGISVFNTGGDGNEYLYISRTTDPDAAQIQAGDNTAYRDIILNPISGNVGIGTTNPQDRLDVNGYVRANGSRLTSDARLKEDIEPIEDALAIVSQLRGVSYNWIDPSHGEGRQIGVVAQEVEQVLPEVVHTDSQGYKSVEYAKLVAPLIEAIKELKAENDNLKAKLRQRDNELARRLEAIEAKLAE